jgi:hypothetical protein
MDATYIFLCGVVWARSQEEAAGLELIRATGCPVPELRVLARAMLRQAGTHSSQLIGNALSQGQMSAVQASLCAFEGEPSGRNKKLAVLLAVFAIAVTSAVAGMKNPVVGRPGDVSHTEHRCENAVNSADHTTLVAAVKAAGLVDTLEGAGPFTVFAPTTKRSPSCLPAPWKRC